MDFTTHLNPACRSRARALRVAQKVALAAAAAMQWLFVASLAAQERPETPHVDSVSLSVKQPHERAAETLWFDDFDSGWRDYPEKSGSLTRDVAFGRKGQSLETFYPKGERGGGAGSCKVWFGDNPIDYGQVGSKIVRKGEKFEEIYMRAYVKHQHGWEGGGPAKLMRMTSFVSNSFAQSMISHLWSSGESDCVTLDPVRCVVDGRVMAKKYNDWEGMKWLGNSPAGTFALSKADWWVCVEFRTRLNTPGKSDGECQVWIDGRLDCERRNLDFRGTYADHGINSAMLEAYWNKGAPRDLHRWFDNLVVSTRPIGPVVCPANPTLFKTPYRGPGSQAAWQFELAENPDSPDVVFSSRGLNTQEESVVTPETGEFKSGLTGKRGLASGKIYFARCRQQSDAGTWSEWSPWHQGFKVE